MFRKKLKDEIKDLKETLENLKEDYYYDQGVINDIIEYQEQFLEYLKEKINQDETNKIIYEEIIKEFEQMMI